MGHCIHAVVLRGPFDRKLAQIFDLKPYPLTDDLTLFPFTAGYLDHWAEKLEVDDFVDVVPLLNSCVIHHMINTIAADPLFAVIETNYFGGHGTQS
ncbi:MAG: hypothetical protein AB7V46_24865, partial [Thermomicrobiales bacterium]